MLCQSKATRIRSMNLKRFTFTEGAPLTQDERGSIRVTGSRVTLDTLVHRYHAGDTVDQIHESFPTVSVAPIKRFLSGTIITRSKLMSIYRSGTPRRKDCFRNSK